MKEKKEIGITRASLIIAIIVALSSIITLLYLSYEKGVKVTEEKWEGKMEIITREYKKDLKDLKNKHGDIVEVLTAENKSLQNTINLHIREKNILTEELKRVRREYDNLENDYGSLEIERRQLENRFSVLQRKVANQRVEKIKLQDNLENITKRRDSIYELSLIKSKEIESLENKFSLTEDKIIKLEEFNKKSKERGKQLIEVANKEIKIAEERGFFRSKKSKNHRRKHYKKALEFLEMANDEYLIDCENKIIVLKEKIRALD